jgi:hypothetical protein
MLKTSLWKRASLKGAPLPETLKAGKIRLCQWCLSLYGNSVREIWREGSFNRHSERYVTEGSANGSSPSVKAPLKKDEKPGRMAHLLRTLPDMYKEVLETEPFLLLGLRKGP